jgi:hypothetical protein
MRWSWPISVASLILVFVVFHSFKKVEFLLYLNDHHVIKMWVLEEWRYSCTYSLPQRWMEVNVQFYYQVWTLWEKSLAPAGKWHCKPRYTRPWPSHFADSFHSLYNISLKNALPVTEGNQLRFERGSLDYEAGILINTTQSLSQI